MNSPKTCAAIGLLGGLGFAALSGCMGAEAAVTSGILSWLAGVGGNQFQSWFGSKIKNPPPGAEEVFKNHHISVLLQGAIINAVEKKVPWVREKRGNASDLFCSAGKILARRLGDLAEHPSGPFTELRDFNVTAIIDDFVAHQGKVHILTEKLWQTLIQECPKLKDLTPTEHDDLVAGLHQGFGEALWGLIKHDAAHDRQAFAAVELLYLSRILQAVREIPAAAPPDLSGLHARIGLIMQEIKDEQRSYFVEILGGIESVKEILSHHTDLLQKILAALTLPRAIHTLHTLPPVPRGFTGRIDELESLRKSSTHGAAHITGLKGMGGIGKTALALVLAHEWAPRFPDAALLLDGKGLAGDAAPTAAQLMEQVIRAFHPEVGNLPDDPAATYCGVLHGKKALILLDNAKDAAQARPLLPPDGCALIVTSRAGFPLDGIAPYHVGRMDAAEAEILLRSAYAPLTADEVKQLLHLCAGLPLALKLAAAHLAMDAADHHGTANVAAYLAKLSGGRLAHLDSEAEDAGEITISEALRLSVEPLPAPEHQAWVSLAIFTSPFDARAAQEIAGADAKMRDRFLRRSLLESTGPDRYRLHDLAADYARTLLTPQEIETLILAHADHYTALADAADKLYLDGEPVAGLALFDRERPQIEAAWQAMATRDDLSADRRMITLVNAVVYVSNLRFPSRQIIAWQEARLCAARRVGHRVAEGNALGNLGNVHAELGDARKAIEYYEQCLVLHREIGDRRGEGTTLGNIGIAHFLLSDVRTAIGYYEQQLEITREIGDRRVEGNALGNLGTAHANLGDARMAIVYYEQHLELHREIGDRRGEGTALGNLGTAHFDLGDARKAIGYYEKHLEIAREMGDRRGEGTGLWNSALAYDSLGNREEAVKLAKAALTIRVAIEDPSAAKVQRKLAEWNA